MELQKKRSISIPNLGDYQVPTAEQLLVDIIDTMREPLLVLDPDFRIMQANSAFFRLFGSHPDETIGAALFALGDGQWDIPPLRDLLNHKLAVVPRLDDYEIDHSFPGIGRRVMLLNARAIAKRAYAPRIVLLTFEDITARRTAEVQLHSQHMELKRSNSALDEFAAVASHDMQEPLRKIQTFGERLHAAVGETMDDVARGYLDRMLDAAGRMRKLVDDLLVYSHVSAQRREFAATDLAVIAREVVRDLETAIADEHGSVELGELPTIEADPLQMRQLLQNLIGNALKYRRKDEDPQVLISSVRNEAGLWKIAVADNGIGFDNRYADRIFKVFERLHGRTEYKGSGIGLAICRRIAERHGGTISATAEEGRGTTFTVTLPATQANPGQVP